MALLRRLETDRSLAAFRGQFVPIKLTTDENDQWFDWTRRYPHEGQGIPILYVIRADGESLYARSGTLQGAALPQMLLATLNQSGRTFSDAETDRLRAAVRDASAALQDDDLLAAARALGPLKGLGTLGELASYSALAQRADEIAGAILESADARIDEARAGLQDAERALESALFLVEAEGAYEGFPRLKASVTQALRAASRDGELAAVMTQARSLVRARRLAAGAATARSAAGAYERVIRGFPGSEVDRIAREELARLDPDAAILQDTVSGEATAESRLAFRTWTDNTGRYSVTARLIDVRAGNVTLETEEGRAVVLAVERLSADDRQYVENSVEDGR